jgi:dihydrofolate reductase
MSISLDGFVAGPNTSAANPLGEGGERLHEWLFADPPDPRDTEVATEQRDAVGAVVLGRRTFDVGVDIWGDVPYPVPCFVLTHRPHADRAMTSGTFTFITAGVADAVEAAKAVAGDKSVQVMGGQTVQQVVAAGLVDELQLNLVPVLMGRGVRMFDQLAADHIELVRTRIIESDRVTHLRFSVVGR